MIQSESAVAVAAEPHAVDTAGEFERGPSVADAVLADTSHLRIPSRPEWIAPTVEYLAERAVRSGACPLDRETNLTLALHEALTNSVIHGNLELSSELKEQGDTAFAEALAARAGDPVLSGRVVDVQTAFNGACCRWTLTDQGKGFDVAATLARATSDDPEIFLASGRGMMLIQALLDEVHYDLGGRRVELVLHHTGSEKRRHPRRPAQDMIRVAPIAADGSVDWTAAYHALSRNLSPGGIGLLQTRLATSSRVLIGLDWADGEFLYVPAEVRHCEALGDGVMQLGCCFQTSTAMPPVERADNEDIEEAIGALLHQLDGQALVPHERRVHQRVVYTERIGIDGGPGPTVGFARDVSKGGISFVVHQNLPLETRTLSLPQRDNPPLRVRVQVVRCAPLMAGVFEVGARFVGLEINEPARG